MLQIFEHLIWIVYNESISVGDAFIVSKNKPGSLSGQKNLQMRRKKKLTQKELS